MKNMWQQATLVVFAVMQFAALSRAKDEDLRCGVCRAIVNEINLSIRSVDPKKKLQVGSFRIDSKGNQDLREIPLAHSHTHISEQFDKLCGERIQQWGVAVKKDGGRRAVIRKYSLEGAMVDTKSMKLDEKAHSRLVSVCYDFVEDHEEDCIPVFQKDNNATKEDQEKELCIEMLGVCTEAEIKFQAELQSQGIRDAILDGAKSGKDTLNVSPGIVKDIPEDELGEDEEDFVDTGDDDDEDDAAKDEL